MMLSLKQFIWLKEDKETSSFNSKEIPSDLHSAFKFLKTLKIPLIGTGDKRFVFALSPDKALKLSRYDSHVKGLGNKNNKVEVEKSECMGSEFLPKIFDYDPINYNWIVVERVLSFDPNKLEENNETFPEFDKAVRKLYGVNSYEFMDWLSGWDLFEDKYEDIDFDQVLESNPKSLRLKDTLKQCRIKADDLHAANFGIRPNGEVVVVDYA